MPRFVIDGTKLKIEDIYLLASGDIKLVLSDEVRKKISKNRRYLETILEDPNQIIYGINTGFGALCNVKISDANLEKLQENLVHSHACGAGELVPQDICKMILLLKIINLSFGYSGIRPELIDKLIELYNAGIYPVIFQLGSLGASGDLAPLAHLSLPLILSLIHISEPTRPY